HSQHTSVAAANGRMMRTAVARRTPKPLDLEGLMAYAGRTLAGHAQTISELREKLKRRAARGADVDEVLARLKPSGYLNDKRFAESFAAGRRKTRRNAYRSSTRSVSAASGLRLRRPPAPRAASVFPATRKSSGHVRRASARRRP